MSESATRRPVLAASIAVFREGQVLLARRAKPPAEGRWSLPGGRVEPGETLAEAALRELSEETGLSAELIGFVQHVEHIERDSTGGIVAHAVICAFAGHWVAGEARLCAENSDSRWADPFAPGEGPFTRGLEGVLTRAARMAGLPSPSGERP